MLIGSFSVDWFYNQDAGVASMGACCYHRIVMPLRELRKHGYETVLGLMFRQHPDGHIQVAEGDGVWVDPDIVIFQRWMGREGPDLVRRARACGQIVINEIDDDFWSLPKGHPAVAITDPVAHPDHNREHYRAMIAASDGIIASTRPLADVMGELGPPVFLCRNAVDLENWPLLEPSGGLRVGWVGAAKWRANDLAGLVGVLGPFLKREGGEFVHVGHLDNVRPVWEQLQIPRGVKVTAISLTPIWDYPKAWADLSLVVVPLEDIPFNHSKSWLRGLEASACGFPFIAQDVPEYRELGAGRLARQGHEWRHHLRVLLDPDVRRAEGLANRARAEELSIDKHWQDWAGVLAEFGCEIPVAA